MRGIWIAVATGAVALGCELGAFYVGNPSEPAIVEKGLWIPEHCWVSVKTGYQGDWIITANMEGYDSPPIQITQFGGHVNQGAIALNILDRIELYGTVGGAWVDMDYFLFQDGIRRTLRTEDQLVWGAGLRVLLFQWGHLAFGASAGYQGASLSLRWGELGTVVIPPAIFDSDLSVSYDQWQGAAGFSYEVGMFTPYVSAIYSYAHGQAKGSDQFEVFGLVALPSFHFKSQTRPGLALGCTLSPNRIVDLNFEARFFSEQAVSMAGMIKF